MTRAAIVICVFAASIFGQQKVDPSFMHQRIWATVPVIGTGKPGDPLRPMFISFAPPVLTRAAAATKIKLPDRQADILASQVWFSDDGKTALVELVAANRDAFKEILNSKLPGVKIFERGKNTKQDVETEFRKYKANFSIDAATSGRAQ